MPALPTFLSTFILGVRSRKVHPVEVLAGDTKRKVLLKIKVLLHRIRILSYREKNERSSILKMGHIKDGTCDIIGPHR